MSTEDLRSHLYTMASVSPERKSNHLMGAQIWDLSDRFRVPLDEVAQLAQESGLIIDENGFVRKGVAPPRLKRPTVIISDKKFLSEHMTGRMKTDDRMGYFGDHKGADNVD